MSGSRRVTGKNPQHSYLFFVLVSRDGSKNTGNTTVTEGRCREDTFVGLETGRSNRLTSSHLRPGLPSVGDSTVPDTVPTGPSFSTRPVHLRKTPDPLCLRLE